MGVVTAHTSTCVRLSAASSDQKAFSDEGTEPSEPSEPSASSAICGAEGGVTRGRAGAEGGRGRSGTTGLLSHLPGIPCANGWRPLGPAVPSPFRPQRGDKPSQFVNFIGIPWTGPDTHNHPPINYRVVSMAHKNPYAGGLSTQLIGGDDDEVVWQPSESTADPSSSPYVFEQRKTTNRCAPSVLSLSSLSCPPSYAGQAGKTSWRRAFGSEITHAARPRRRVARLCLVSCVLGGRRSEGRLPPPPAAPPSSAPPSFPSQ